MRDLLSIIDQINENSYESHFNNIFNGLNQLIEAAPVEPEVDLATKADHRQLVPVLFDALKEVGAVDADTNITKTVKEVTEKGRISCVRTAGINSQQLLQAMAVLGFKETPLNDQQAACSGQFTIHGFVTPNGITVTVVLAGRKKSAAAGGATDDLVLNRKDLTPVSLGLAGSYPTRAQLADATKKAVNTKVKNEKIASALVELVDIAMNRGSGNLSPESLEYVRTVRGMISQDFGEILAPMALAQDNEEITFPAGNEKLIDVTVGGKVRYSVKALGGSGTSMNSLGSLLDEYDATLTDEGKKSLFRNGIKIWQSASRKEGKVVDKICYAAHLNQIPEYLSYVDILGGEFQTFDELKKLLTPLVKKLDYPGFLEMILPASQAGHWGINIGLPDDSNYYLGLTDKKSKPGIAGKNSYDNDHVHGAANIITYSIGKGFEFMVRRGPDKQQYKDIMNDMIKQMNCQLGHVDIDNSGQLIITSKPFGNLDFEFDYHAPSNLAGNNRPGFLIVPPNKGDKGKKSKAKANDIYHNGDEVADISDADIDAKIADIATGKSTSGLRPKSAEKTREKRTQAKTPERARRT